MNIWLLWHVQSMLLIYANYYMHTHIGVNISQFKGFLCIEENIICGFSKGPKDLKQC